MPNTLDKALFVTGLIGLALGQVILNLLSFPSLSRSLYYEAPIDYGHWLLFIGALLIVPYAARLPRQGINRLAGPVLIVGTACVFGMCTIDLVMWSFSGAPGGQDLIRQLTAEPSIWLPFITVGPTYVFVTGLVLPSLAYLSHSKIGVALVVGSAVAFFTILAGFNSWFFVAGYAVMAIGYALCFSSEHRDKDDLGKVQ